MHGKCQGRKSKAEIIVMDGIVTEIRYSEVAGRAPLEFRENYPETQMNQTLINIVAAETASDYCLRLTFDDGVKQTVDFKPFLTHARHPDIRAYLDPAKFSAFRIEYGELVWGDYNLCFPINDLYRNQLEHTTHREAAA